MNHRKLILMAGLSLALAALGCSIGGTAGSTPVYPPTPAASAQPTVTPAPAQSSQAGQPSATPYAEPTTAVPPTAAPSAQTFDAACGTGSAALPANLPKFADYADTILATINAHSSVQAIDQGLRAWSAITDKIGVVRGSDDLTGDGAAELLVIVQAPQAQFPDAVAGLPGDLYIYGCANGRASLLFADTSTPDRSAPELVTVADLNSDHVNEVVYLTHNCGASTCFIMPHVIEWNASAGKFETIFPENDAVPAGRMDIKDVDGDGMSEIILHVGGLGSAGAGPQRSYDETWAWNGTAYALKTRVVTSQQYPIHYLNDADTAVAKGDVASALPLYQHVIDDPNPLVFVTQDEIPALKAYAYYRLMLAEALTGDSAGAQAAHAALATQFANTPAAPGASFAQLADVFWKAYQPKSDAKAGCAQVIAFATANPDSFAALNNFGYSNLTYKPEDLCPAK